MVVRIKGNNVCKALFRVWHIVSLQFKKKKRFLKCKLRELALKCGFKEVSGHFYKLNTYFFFFLNFCVYKIYPVCGKDNLKR